MTRTTQETLHGGRTSGTGHIFRPPFSTRVADYPFGFQERLNLRTVREVTEGNGRDDGPGVPIPPNRPEYRTLRVRV